MNGYKGKKPCVGCGSTIQRERENTLCWICKQDLKFGQDQRAASKAREVAGKGSPDEVVTFRWNKHIVKADEEQAAAFADAVLAWLRSRELHGSHGPVVCPPASATGGSVYGCEDAHVTLADAEHAERVIVAVAALVQSSWSAGLQQGSSLLQGLHAGRISPHEFAERIGEKDR